MNNEVKLFDITELAIQELKERYSGLTINGIDDSEGYKAVKTARIVMKGYRVDVDKRRKELTEDALKHQRFINSEAKKITEKLSEIEDYLASEEKKIDDAIAAIKAEEFRQLEIIKQDRIEMMLKHGYRYNGNIFTAINSSDIKTITEIMALEEDRFNAFIVKCARQIEAEEAKRLELQAEQERQVAAAKLEQDRIAAELAAERAKLAAERAEQEAKAKALADQERAIKAESDRLAKEQEDIRQSLDYDRKVREQAAEAQLKADIEKWNKNEDKQLKSDSALIDESEWVDDIRKDVREIKTKHYLIEICGQFKVSTYAYATSSDEAKSIAFELLNNGDLDVDFEPSDCEITEGR